MAKSKKKGKKGSKRGGHRKSGGKRGGGRRRSRRGSGIPPMVKAGLAITGLGVAGFVAAPLLSSKVDKVAPYASAAMIGLGGLALHKGNVKKAAPYLLVAGVGAATVALTRTDIASKLQAKAEEIGPVTERLALAESSSSSEDSVH
jgi:hypothetical protein